MQRSLHLVALVLVSALAGCGGAAESNPNANGGSSNGGASNGGAPSGGQTNHGGALSSGGAPTNGGAPTGSGGATYGGAPSSGGTSESFGGKAASGAGGSSGSPSMNGGANGSGGSTNAICQLSWDNASCGPQIEKWWHNPATGFCEPRYCSSTANQNQFDSFEECVKTCDDARTHCDQPNDCELRSPSCCGACEPITRANLIAVNHAAAPQICNTSCGACPAPAPNESTSRYFIPSCVEHRCAVIDIRETAITECATDTDCALRSTAGCCQSCGDSGDPIAINKNTNVVDAFCGGAAVPCPACVGGIPSGYATACRNARCVVERAFDL